MSLDCLFDSTEAFVTGDEVVFVTYYSVVRCPDGMVVGTVVERCACDLADYAEASR